MGDGKSAMSSYKAQVEQYGVPISKEKFQELRSYAEEHGIRLSGFKDFVGDIEVIKTVVDDICEIAQDFPKILDERNGIWLELDYDLGTDFATTESGHIIHLNAVYFSDMRILRKDYGEGVKEGRFVRGTDWRAIARHETGHVVAGMYHIDPMQVAMCVRKTSARSDVYAYLMEGLSIYSVEYRDGREIISESFSAFYGKTGNTFAEDFLEVCKNISRKGR